MMLTKLGQNFQKKLLKMRSYVGQRRFTVNEMTLIVKLIFTTCIVDRSIRHGGITENHTIKTHSC
jgi:hypothetical protein